MIVMERGYSSRVNVADTDLFPFIVIEMVGFVPAVSPLQWEKAQPGAGMAVS